MARKLTTKAVENAKPGPHRREISDGGSGLFLIVQPSGHRSFALRYRFHGRPSKLTLGAWPKLSLAAARKAGADALLALAEGHNPGRARADAKLRAAVAQANTLAAVCESHLKREGKKIRTADQRERILRTLVLPALGNRPIASIKRSEIVTLLDDIEDNNGARTADVALAHLRAVMNWFAARDDEFRPPIVRGMQRQATAEHRRSRVLNDAEIRAIWNATDATDEEPFPTLIRFLLAVPARRGEAAGLRWEEIDDEGIWLLPAARSKSGVEVARPLSKMALALLATRPRNCPYVFSSNGITATTSFVGPKKKLDAASGVTGWVIHDLRRVGRSLLSRAGVNSDVAERCLGHALPSIRATYDRHRFVSEVRHAHELLAAEIERIIHPPGAAVVPLRR